jgi:hypothetical protein
MFLTFALTCRSSDMLLCWLLEGSLRRLRGGGVCCYTGGFNSLSGRLNGRRDALRIEVIPTPTPLAMATTSQAELLESWRISAHRVGSGMCECELLLMTLFKHFWVTQVCRNRRRGFRISSHDDKM